MSFGKPINAEIVQPRGGQDDNLTNGSVPTVNVMNHQVPTEQNLKQFELEDKAIPKIQTFFASSDPQLSDTMAQFGIINNESDMTQTNGGSSVFSDTSSDVSNVTTSVPNLNSAFVLPLSGGISEQDINQVEMFYRSQKTDVKVCKSLANLYISAPKLQERALDVTKQKKDGKSPDTAISRTPKPSDISKEDWEFAKTGIPVLVLNTGEHVRERNLRIVLAEKGTGFTLWQDQINHLTQYNTPHTNFHTLNLSTDSTRLVGLSFDEGKAATDFAEAVKSLTANPDDDLLKLSKKKKKKEKKSKTKPPKKVDISQPCCFVHVTKIERPDLSSSMFPTPPSGIELDRLGIPRAMSESSGISECSKTSSEY